ncbi:flavin reductase family protein [Nitriliruptor alkaliphilus]|uniref:flavin reductase family protein n=1 Tax=Nitriliruptor alkaliphilus TaxID=427918 RepID=UPI001FE07117|nr:flavin reductase family protein [Nitriliruptor alkaliphilus]
MTSSHPAPPDRLDTDLELSPADWQARQIYFVMTGLVIPRPIAWVSTVGDDGVRNVAPHSYFNVVSHDPPHVVFSSIGEKDTLRNVRASGEFVVNLVTEHVLEPMNATSADLPHGEDEFAWFGLEEAPSTVVAPPRVAAAKAHLECRLVHELPVGNGNLVVGEVVHIHVAPDVWRDGRIDPELLRPVGRLAGTSYGELGEVFKLPRPSWEQVQGQPPDERIPRRD